MNVRTALPVPDLRLGSVDGVRPGPDPFPLGVRHRGSRSFASRGLRSADGLRL